MRNKRIDSMEERALNSLNSLLTEAVGVRAVLLQHEWSMKCVAVQCFRYGQGTFSLALWKFQCHVCRRLGLKQAEIYQESSFFKECYETHKYYDSFTGTKQTHHVHVIVYDKLGMLSQCVAKLAECSSSRVLWSQRVNWYWWVENFLYNH